MIYYYFDIIVVGGGHAGIEAIFASSNMKLNVLLVTNNIDLIGDLACNPSIGGIGKSNLVKEIDIFGGVMGLAADLSGINFKKLNISRGFAVRSTRVQVDKNLYKYVVQSIIKNRKNIKLIQQHIIDLIVCKNIINGVVTSDGLSFFSKAVILTLGTFLHGKIFIGNIKYLGGKIIDKSSIYLSDKLREFFPYYGRLKTGTPPRIDKKSINFFNLDYHVSDEPIPFFSNFMYIKNILKKKKCYITNTNYKTHNIIFDNIHLSSMYSNNLTSLSPRYCPSIEDKLIKYKNKFFHQIFLEPEDICGNEIYSNGLSTSLPYDVQINFIKTIKGLNNAEIIKPGYAVEYDYFNPKYLNLTLEVKNIKGLFFAGQINGTTGYEEAASQGLIAGINASLYVLNEGYWIPSKFDSYIGVMIDDLINNGIDEPYRMFTSRSEFRLLIREDNINDRLLEKSKKLKLINDKKIFFFNQKKKKIKFNLYNLYKYKYYTCYKLIINNFLFLIIEKFKYYNFIILLKKQNLNYILLNKILFNNINIILLKLIKIKIVYSTYIKKQFLNINKIIKKKFFLIPKNFDYKKVKCMSMESIEKLNLIKPKFIYQVLNISGLSFTVVVLLINFIKKKYQ